MNKDEELKKLLFNNLMAIIDYTKGSINLDEVKENLKRSGFDDNAIEKVLKKIDRKNIINFPKNN